MLAVNNKIDNDNKGENNMAKKGLFKGIRIEKKLKKAFNLVTIISALASVIGLICILVVTSDFKNAMINYAMSPCGNA